MADRDENALQLFLRQRAALHVFHSHAGNAAIVAQHFVQRRREDIDEWKEGILFPKREPGDGLRIFPGPLGNKGVAATWTPDASLCDTSGKVKPEFLWSALDCPGAFSFEAADNTGLLLGEMAVGIHGQHGQIQHGLALRIGEIHNLYDNAKESLPERARALLEPLEDLSSRVMSSPRDLNRFLKQWDRLRRRMQKIRPSESDAVRRLLDEIQGIQAGIRLGDRVHEWQRAYAQLKDHLPAKVQLGLIKFDAIDHRVTYSRQELQRVWSHTLANLRRMNLREVHPWRLAKAMLQEFALTTSFAANFREFSKQ